MRTDGLQTLGAVLVTGLSLALAAGTVSAQTDANVTWSGDGATPLWNVAANWYDGEYPNTNTPGTIIFSIIGQSVTGVLDVSRTVYRVNAGVSGQTTSHTVDLGDTMLTITNRLWLAGNSTDKNRTTLTLTNGTLRLGSDTSAAGIDIGGVATLRFAPDSRLATHNLNSIVIRATNRDYGLLDLRGAEILGGALTVNSILMLGEGQFGSIMYIDGSTSINAINVKNSLVLGRVAHNSQTPQFIGDPNDTFVMDGRTFGKLPANIDLIIGVDENQRGELLIIESTNIGDARGTITVAKGGEGVFTAYLSRLGVGVRTGTGTRVPCGLLDLAHMKSCFIDAENVFIGPGRPEALITDDERGELLLPPGTATVGSATIGATDGLGYGRLSMSNTMFTVTNSLAINKTAQITIQVGAESGGIDFIGDAGNGSLDPGATITVRFLAWPGHNHAHYGLRLAGDHKDTLNAMGVRLTIDSAGLDGKEAQIFTYRGYTYIGMPPPGGLRMILR